MINQSSAHILAHGALPLICKYIPSDSYWGAEAGVFHIHLTWIVVDLNDSAPRDTFTFCGTNGFLSYRYPIDDHTGPLCEQYAELDLGKEEVTTLIR